MIQKKLLFGKDIWTFINLQQRFIMNYQSPD